jgi:hypothetical protein
MNHCVDCLHWDEESAEDNPEGLGFCLASEHAVEAKRSALTLQRVQLLILRVRGDWSCPLFQPKRAKEPHVSAV